jgi:hypothetical protein
MSDDSSRPDFTLRIAQHRAMSDTYRTRAQATHDDLLRKVYSDLAATYENMARVIERTTLRVESIQLTIARVREKIAVAEPHDKDNPGAVA